MLSGAICWINGPVGTLKVKADEYANLQYFAWLAFMGQATNWPGESMKWCHADGWLQRIWAGWGTSLTELSIVTEGYGDSGEVQNACVLGKTSGIRDFSAQ
jgi:hypothetical protein